MQKLTLQEEEIMTLIWATEPCCVKDIILKMEEPHPPYTTVASIVKNLEKKEYVTSEKKGKTYEYRASITKERYKSAFMKGFIKNYFKNSYKEMVSFFAKEEKISAEELEDIINMIENKRDK